MAIGAVVGPLTMIDLDPEEKRSVSEIKSRMKIARSIGVREMQTPPGGQRLSHIVHPSGIPQSIIQRLVIIIVGAFAKLDYGSRNQLLAVFLPSLIE